MKLNFALAAAVALMGSFSPVNAQNTEDVMHPLDLSEPGIYSNPAIEMWKDLLDKAIAGRKANPATSSQPLAGYVFAKEFKDGDTTVLASIYRAWDTVCDNGQNSSTTKVGWGTCPVRVKITEGGKSRIVEDTVCTTITALVDPANRPDDKNYAAFIPNLGIQFNVASKGRYAKECTKLVRFGKASTAPSQTKKDPGAVVTIAPANLEQLFLGSMLPPVTIEKLTGQGTSGAVAEGRPLEADMKAACEALDSDPGAIKECLRGMKERYGRSYRVTADCIARTMQPAIGGTWTYAGVYRPDEAFGDKDLTKWRDANGQIQPVGRASDAYSLDQNWKVLCGARAQSARSPAPTVQTSFDPVKFGGMAYDHNGSVVQVNEKSGEIRYETPKKAIAGTVRPGTLLFKGTFRELAKLGQSSRGTVEGTAYVFKKGCEPAPYAVSGTYDAWSITLKGAAPKWNPNSCATEESAKASQHGVLKFQALGDM